MNERNHFKYIDALRGFAFLGVLTVHTSQQVPSLPFLHLASIGQYGVQLFFLLSAVTLLRSSTSRASKERSPLRNFFVRRLLRIAPLFWFGILLYFLIDGCAPGYFAPGGIKPWQFLTTAFFLHGWTPTSINSVVPGGWSIAAEMTFYACLPFLATRITSAWAALSLSLFTVIGSVGLSKCLAPVLGSLMPPSEQYLIPSFFSYWFPAQLPVFLIGFALYYFLHDNKLITLLDRPGHSALLALAGAIGIVGLTRMHTGPLFPMNVCYSIAFAMMILALKIRPIKIAVNSLTCGIGTLSFSCYITHFAALKLALHLLGGYHERFLLASSTQFILLWTTTLALTILASLVTYFLIEKPGIRLGSLLIRYWETKPASAPQIREPAPIGGDLAVDLSATPMRVPEFVLQEGMGECGATMARS